ncbi:hypothetical protein ACLOJK_010445 [Asimina triloba]
MRSCGKTDYDSASRRFLFLPCALATRRGRMAKSAFLFVFLILAVQSHGRMIMDASGGLVSDGAGIVREPSFLYLGLPSQMSVSEDESCEQTYGFMPCTTTVLGNLFLAVTYGYLMFTAATYLSTGSELLLEILGPGVVGGLFLPILGALPDALLILGINFLPSRFPFGFFFFFASARVPRSNDPCRSFSGSRGGKR